MQETLLREGKNKIAIHNLIDILVLSGNHLMSTLLILLLLREQDVVDAHARGLILHFSEMPWTLGETFILRVWLQS